MISSGWRWRRSAGALAVLVAPVAAVILVLVLAGRLAPGPAVLALACMAAGLLVILARPLAALDRLGLALRDLAEAGPDAARRPGLARQIPGGAALDAAFAALGSAAAAQAAEAKATAAATEAILDGIPDPLLLLDGEGRVTRANAAAVELLGVEPAGRDLAEVIRDPAILDAVTRAIEGAAMQTEELTLPGTVERSFSARIARLPPGAPAASRVIVTLFEVTAIKRAEQMRADFVANVSHELRTPLATLLGFTETLRGPARDDAPARERFLGIMHDQAQRMTRLVSDLLSLPRTEASEHTPPTESVELRRVLSAVIDSAGLAARTKGMTIQIDLAPDLPPLIGDGDQLAQVLQNLIDNAVKYGRAGTQVTVTARAAPRPPGGAGRLSSQAVAIAIADEGDGIPREHLPRLTERFYRVDAARSRQLGGTGLGLAIVKHIVNRHRGALVIDSEVGRGSVFTVYLPARS